MTWFQVKSIKVRHAAIHKQVNQPLGFPARRVRHLCSPHCTIKTRQQADAQRRPGRKFDKSTTAQTIKFGKTSSISIGSSCRGEDQKDSLASTVDFDGTVRTDTLAFGKDY